MDEILAIVNSIQEQVKQINLQVADVLAKKTEERKELDDLNHRVKAMEDGYRKVKSDQIQGQIQAALKAARGF
jgi:hypothetical protein